MGERINSHPQLVDFSKPELYANTLPTACTINGQTVILEKQSWPQLLIAITEWFIASNNPIIGSLSKLVNGNKVFFAPKDANIGDCTQLLNGNWVFVAHSSQTIITLISIMCYRCGVHLKDVTVTYTLEDLVAAHITQLLQPKSRTEEANVPTSLTSGVEDTEQAFKSFMRSIGKADSTISLYFIILRYELVNTLHINDRVRTNLFEYGTAADFEPVNTFIQSLPKFLKIDNDKHNSFSVALNAYRSFLVTAGKNEASSAKQAITLANLTIADVPEDSDVSHHWHQPIQSEGHAEEINASTTLVSKATKAKLSYYKVFGIELSDSYKNSPIEGLNFSVRTSNCLRRWHYRTVWDLLNCSENFEFPHFFMKIHFPLWKGLI
ncbi:hypothetical protein FACS1894187_08680 [Synergistales bacterium]|nr:hypothetical protein FACS1894187_08680 [Synergistales bacterium]